MMIAAITAHSQYIINTTALRLLNGSASIAGTIPGTIYYEPSTNKFMFREGNTWVMLGSGGGGGITNGDKGDITISNLGATMLIDNGAITFAKMQTIGTNTILGRISASTGLVEQLTPAQVNTMLPAFTRTLKGLVPPSGGTNGTDNFLREDGTWAVPPGTGGTGSGTTETASNGLYKSGNDIRLGITNITESTQIGIANANQFRIVDFSADDFMFGINGFARAGWNIGYGNLNVSTGQQAVMNIDPTGLYWRAQNSSGVGSTWSFRNDFVTFTDGRATKRGIEYAGPGYETQPYSLTTKNYVDQLVASVSSVPQFTSSTSGIVPASGSSPSTKILYGDGVWRTAPSGGSTYSVFTRTVNGLVPAPGGSTTNRYMREDGTWSVPPDANTTYSTFNASSSGLVPASGTANGTKTLYDDGVWRVPSGSLPLAYGTYTPVATAVNQTSSISAGPAHYIRVGNNVTVNGHVTFYWSVAPTTAKLELTLPIASNFAVSNDAIGHGDVTQSNTDTDAFMSGNATTDKVVLNVHQPEGSVSSTTVIVYYQYQYVIK